MHYSCYIMEVFVCNDGDTDTMFVFIKLQVLNLNKALHVKQLQQKVVIHGNKQNTLVKLIISVHNHVDVFMRYLKKSGAFIHIIVQTFQFQVCFHVNFLTMATHELVLNLSNLPIGCMCLILLQIVLQQTSTNSLPVIW